MAVKIDIFLNKQKKKQKVLTNMQLYMKYDTTIPKNYKEIVPPYSYLVYKQCHKKYYGL